MRWLRKHQAALALLLAALILAMLAIGLARRGLLTLVWLAHAKDGLAALNSLVGMSAILIGFALSYFRFFAGRTFARRAELSIAISPVAIDSATILHGVTVTIANVGTLSIHAPEIKVHAIHRRADGSETRSPIDDWVTIEPFATEGLEAVIDAGETAQYYATRTIDATASAISYAAVARDRHGNIWHAFTLAPVPQDRSP